MDPTKIYKHKDVNALAPPPSGGSRDGSIRRSAFSADGCTYWSLFRTSCVNGECKEEAQKFRQCPNRAREQASIDPQTKQEVWREIDEKQEAPLLNPLPFSFRALGGATDDLVSDVLPQFDQLRQEIESDPMFRGLHRVMAMLGGDVPFSGTAQPLPFTLTRGGGRFGGEMPPRAESSRSGSRDIPIVDASSLSSSAPPRENGLRNSAMPHPRDLSEDARMQGPVDSIRHSFDRWTNKLARIVNGTPAQKPRPSADDRSREDKFDSDDSHD